MASAALVEWRNGGLLRLDELEAVHSSASGSGPGRRWGTSQLNRHLFVALVAQFQEYCRALHNEAVGLHVARAAAGQRDLIRTLLTQKRELDVRNPRRGALGSDFGRLGFKLILELNATGPATRRRLDRLETLVDLRNAIGHGNEAEIQAIIGAQPISATLASYRAYRRAVDLLAGTMDAVVSNQMARLLGVPPPW